MLYSQKSQIFLKKINKKKNKDSKIIIEKIKIKKRLFK